MELSEKIQKLRKEQGMTQEQFAERLFVSRTAVSKWETGRGMPNIESLQMIARVCGITLDELLRAEEVITIAEQENQENLNRLVGYVDGVVNVLALAGVLLAGHHLLAVSCGDGFVRYRSNPAQSGRAGRPKENGVNDRCDFKYMRNLAADFERTALSCGVVLSAFCNQGLDQAEKEGLITKVSMM